MVATPNTQQVADRLEAKFPNMLRFEFFNRRHIGSNPLRRWSQHAGNQPERGWYGNAGDIFAPTPVLDLVYAYLNNRRSELRIRTLLWRVKDHYDHIHYDTWPMMKDNWWYRPPPKGTLITIEQDGSVHNTFATDEEGDIVLRLGDNNELVRWYQALLNHAGVDPPVVVDGAFGKKTEAAVKQYQGTLKLEQDGMINGTLAGKLSSFSNSKDGRYATKDHEHDAAAHGHPDLLQKEEATQAYAALGHDHKVEGKTV
jgi:hypothetical protein